MLASAEGGSTAALVPAASEAVALVETSGGVGTVSLGGDIVSGTELVCSLSLFSILFSFSFVSFVAAGAVDGDVVAGTFVRIFCMNLSLICDTFFIFADTSKNLCCNDCGVR